MYKYLKILLAFVTTLVLCNSQAQDYNYIHYTIKDGLAGNTVYDVAQDKDGYMFFATENGLSRFDGKEWKTFTVKDGLPDNEVLSLYCDKLNRLWIFAFNNKVCFLKDGKFHTEKNDSLIKKIKLIQPIQNVFEAEDGKIFFVGNYNLFLIEKNFVKSIWSSSTMSSNLAYTEIPSSDNKNRIFIDDTVFYLNGYQLIFEKIDSNNRKITPEEFSNRKIKVFDRGVLDTSNILNVFKKYYHKEEWDNYVPTNQGCIYINCKSNGIIIYLPNKKVGHHFLDFEGNHWFTTMGEGVYKLGSLAFNTYNPNQEENKLNNEIFSIDKVGNKVLCGAPYGKLGFISNNKVFSYKDYQEYSKFSASTDNINRLVAIFKMESSLVLGFDNILGKVQDDKFIFNAKIRPNKSIEKVDNKNLLIATSKGVFKVSPLNLQVIDTLFSQRSTYANYHNHQYYIGTTNGLFVINESKQQNYLGDIHPVLKRRITCIKNYNNKVYVATADAGILVLNNNKVIAVINDSTGLSSNSIKTLHINGDRLWIGTIKGINKLDLTTNKVLTKYTTSDGLPSDIINALYYDDADSTIWVGSPEGLTYFKEKDILGQSMCNLVLENIAISKKNIPSDSNHFSLKYNDNIQFQFVGISLRSGDEITYHYKLQGLDTGYNTTTERLLSYPSLPSGNYTLLLYATNKFGVQSKTYTCSFYVNPPFWKTWWFYGIEILMLITVIWIIFYTRFKRKQKEYKRIADFKVEIAKMEQQALQAQMNPHFIFNCLNSIQQFILNKENDKAFNYLLLFSKLVRDTLDNSEKQYITLAEEIEYLQEYLAMEDVRFGEQFEYKINVEETINKHYVKIPSMILQPFVENALRHGIRQLQHKKGLLKINFFLENNTIVCTVEDNGIGRKAAQLLKSSLHINYQSKGMDLTQRRIELLNSSKENKIEYNITDLENEKQEALGTLVTISFPIS